MGKTYTATIQAKAWKEHTCLSCGSVFSYLLARKVTGQGATADKAQERAETNVVKTLNSEVDPHPCPTCGLVQPDMVGQRRAALHKTIFWIALVAFVVLVVLRLTYAVQADKLTTFVVVACAAVAAAHLLVDRANPNKDPDANRQAVAARVAAGTIRHTPGRAGKARDEHANPTKSVLHSAALALLLVAVAAAAAPEVVRSARGWPANADTYPPVAGPGDVLRVYMEDSIQSIKGYWRGHPRAAVKAAGGAPMSADATTNDNQWGASISAKSSEKSSTSHPWVAVTIPADPVLANQTVQCRVDLSVVYPHSDGSSSFEEQERAMSRTVDVRLGPPGAGGQYDTLWWAGSAGGMGLLLMCGQVLRGSARNLQRSAGPVRLYA
jgi:hypothetical protein